MPIIDGSLLYKKRMKNRKKVRVLYLSPASIMGGPPISLIHLLKHLDKSAYEPIVLTLPNTCPEYKDELAALDIQQFEIDMYIHNWLHSSKGQIYPYNRILYYLKTPGRLGRLLMNGVRIARFIRAHQVDIVHSNIELWLDGALGACLAQRPHIWHIRARIGPDGAIMHEFGLKFVAKVIDKLSQKIVVNSNSTKEPLAKSISTEKIVLIHNGVDPELYVGSRGKLREEHGIGIKDPIVAMVGYASAVKGAEHFVEAARFISKKRPGTVFLVFGHTFNGGDSDYFSFLKSRIEAYELDDRFFFTGFRRDLPELLRDINILVQPMKNGSWSRVVLESMAAGVPVVAWEEDLRSDFVEHGQNGLIVDKSEALGPATLTLLEQKDKAKAMGRNGQRHVRKHFCNKICAERIMAEYAACLNS